MSVEEPKKASCTDCMLFIPRGIFNTTIWLGRVVRSCVMIFFSPLTYLAKKVGLVHEKVLSEKDQPKQKEEIQKKEEVAKESSKVQAEKVVEKPLENIVKEAVASALEERSKKGNMKNLVKDAVKESFEEFLKKHEQEEAPKVKKEKVPLKLTVENITKVVQPVEKPLEVVKEVQQKEEEAKTKAEKEIIQDPPEVNDLPQGNIDIDNKKQDQDDSPIVYDNGNYHKIEKEEVPLLNLNKD